MDNTVNVCFIHNGRRPNPISTCVLLQATEQIQCKLYHDNSSNLFVLEFKY